MSLTAIFDAIPTVWKAIGIIAVATGVGFTAGGTAVSLTQVPAQVEELKQLHGDDVTRLESITKRNADMNYEMSRKQDQMLCMLRTKEQGGDPLDCL